MDEILRALDIVLAFITLGAIFIVIAEMIQMNRRMETIPFTFPPKLSKKFIIYALAACFLFGGGAAAMDYVSNQSPGTRTIPSSGVTTEGTIDFGIYWDVTGTSEVTEIQWGTLEPGQTGNVTVWVKNEDLTGIYCMIAWNETTWQPAGAHQYFDLTWDFGEDALGISRSRKVKMELYVHPDIHDIEDFSFNIVVTGQAQPF